MLSARLRLEWVFDLRYRDLENRWYSAERRGHWLVIRTRGRVVGGRVEDFAVRRGGGPEDQCGPEVYAHSRG